MSAAAVPSAASPFGSGAGISAVEMVISEYEPDGADGGHMAWFFLTRCRVPARLRSRLAQMRAGRLEVDHFGQRETMPRQQPQLLRLSLR